MPFNIDLESLSRKELEQLKSAVEKALSRADTRRREEARKAAEEAARQFGFTLNELSGDKRKGGGSGSAPKYRNPANPSQTWTGRGRQPGWIKEALAAGKDLSTYEI